ncbi:MAG: hypothetical protein GX304_02665 [Clostridiales bacterium]|jgi:hypothetical protein|nr:hypothetical protein [Clostridiales bacterium]
MTELYTGQEYPQHLKLKKKMLNVWLILLGIYIAASVAILLGLVTMPYYTRDDVISFGEKKNYFIAADVLLSTLFWGFSLFFFINKYIRLSRYVRMLKYLDIGLKEVYEGEFLRFGDVVEVKDGVEFYKMITKEWNERKQEYYERKVLIDREIEKFDICPGDRVKYVTQGNVLIKYKIVRKAKEKACGQ